MGRRKKKPVFPNRCGADFRPRAQSYRMKPPTSLLKPARPRVSTRIRVGKKIPKRLQVSRVLVPIDFSPASLEAIEFALPILSHWSAELHLVHVAPDYPLALPDVPMIVAESEMLQRIGRDLAMAAQTYSVALRPGHAHVPKGHAFEQICKLARELKIDMIITSTRGHTGLKHLALGSTAERIVRYSPCPVLVVRSPGPLGTNGEFARRHFALGKILVATDFSECAATGVDYARRLAREFKSKLLLLHSVHLEYYVALDEYARYDFPMLAQQAEIFAREQMRELVRDQSDDLALKGIVACGHPGQEICAKAQEFRADLIVTATHGRTGLKHLFLGSTAEYVVRHAPCPVLVVPSHERPALSSTNNGK
jgi:nucleotide-binding universal stress UspA family protein